MALPSGWSAELPEAVHAHTAFANCDVTYRVDGGKLIAERRLVILKSKVPVADYKQYQAWYDSAGVSGTPYIQLIAPPGPANLSLESKSESKNEAPANGKGDSVKTPDSATPASNPQAAELVQKAGDNIRAMDPDGARKLLDQAKALNPRERGLWMGYAAIDSQLGKSDEAVQDLRNELAYFPDEVKIYHWLAMQKLTNHDQQGAIVSLRQWVKAAPNDPDAALALVQQLHAAKQYDAELTEAQAAITRLGSGAGDLTALKLAVAEAQMQLGYKQEAAALFEPLLKAATDPGQINDIAYNLAEIGTDLPDADAALRKALAALDAESTGWTLTEAPVLLVRKQSLLAAAWDTMGWILYREGSYSEALGYIKAALHTQNSSVVRDHLTAIATALHNPAAAAFAKQTDQQLRTIPLGPAKGRHGTAELRLLIADGKAVGIGPPAANAYTAPAGGDFTPALPGAAEMVKAADLRSLVPPGSNAHLVRSGFVTCHGTVCELVLSPLGAGPG
jgi:tetratricopeptide (TPR) repeat protein